MRDAGVRMRRAGSCLILGVVGCLLGACASTPTSGAPFQEEFVGAPSWVLGECNSYWGGKRQDIICGVGSVTGTRNIAMARSASQARGRTAIARSLGVKVEAMLKDYQATTTGGEQFAEAAADEQHIVDVSRQITKMSLAGTEAKQTWISKSGTVYTLMALDLVKFQSAVSQMKTLPEAVRKAVTERAQAAFEELATATAD